MKRTGMSLLILAVLLLSTEAYSQKGITIRPYARLGINLLTPSLEDLEYVGDWSGADIKKNPMALGAGVQALLHKNDLGLGIDFGAGTLFNQEVIYDEGVGISTNWDGEYSIYILALAEYSPGGKFFVQGGLGPHIVPWYWEYYYDSNNYTDEEDWDNGVGVSFGIMVAAGTEIPLSEKMNLFLLAKLDGIFRYGLMLPFTANVGLTFKL